MTVRVWYPATSARGVRMTLRSYLDLLDKDGPITADVRERLELDLNGIWSDLCTCRVPRAAADARLDALFGTTAAAVRDATPATGRHPVIVYSLGHDMHSLENVVLWEYLASHGFVIAMTAIWLYFAGFESSQLQATLSGRILGLRVTDLSGERISFNRATFRHFAMYFTALTPFAVGYLMAFWTKRRQTLHDYVSSTLVVKKP